MTEQESTQSTEDRKTKSGWTQHDDCARKKKTNVEKHAVCGTFEIMSLASFTVLFNTSAIFSFGAEKAQKKTVPDKLYFAEGLLLIFPVSGQNYLFRCVDQSRPS